MSNVTLSLAVMLLTYYAQLMCGIDVLLTFIAQGLGLNPPTFFVTRDQSGDRHTGNKIVVKEAGPSQWPCGLRLELSSLARTLGSCVRIPLKVWMYVCVLSVFVLSCVGGGLATS
jgi:hypothetical protein